MRVCVSVCMIFQEEKMQLELPSRAMRYFQYVRRVVSPCFYLTLISNQRMNELKNEFEYNREHLIPSVNLIPSATLVAMYDLKTSSYTSLIPSHVLE